MHGCLFQVLDFEEATASCYSDLNKEHHAEQRLLVFSWKNYANCDGRLTV